MAILPDVLFKSMLNIHAKDKAVVKEKNNAAFVLVIKARTHTHIYSMQIEKTPLMMPQLGLTTWKLLSVKLKNMDNNIMLVLLLSNTIRA